MFPKHIPLILLSLGLLFLAACGPGTPDIAATLNPLYTSAAQTREALYTQAVLTSTAQSFATPIPVFSVTPPLLPGTPTPTPISIPKTATPVTRCDWAAFIGDVSVPDGSAFAPSTAFTKTWRLKNIGTCTWTTAYSLVFSSGAQMSGPLAQNLLGNVTPGQMVDISVNLTAPLTYGHYRGYWLLQNPSGVRFGSGPQATAAFWVDINVVGPNPTTTTITADTPDPSTPGQSVAVSVTVSGTGTTPTGTVAITGADSNCTITLSGGSGSCNVVFNTAGTKTITATYSGDANYASSVGTTSHTVNQGTTTTTITADTPDPSVPGQSVAVNVTVSGAGTTPTGTVAITGADTNCTLTLSSGSGSCSVIFNTTGAKTLTATYSGDANYVSSSDTESHAVKNASTTTITGDVPDSSTPGQSVVVGVTVSGTGATPTGTVTISGADANCTITLAGGSGSCNVVFNTTGAKTLTATYSGDANYASSSDTESHTVSQGPSTTTITADAPDPSTPGQSVAVSVTVSGAGATPTGTVIITGADINCTITLVGGSGSCNVVFNTFGAAKILTATYSGDMNYSGSSDTESHDVSQGPSTTTITADIPDPSAALQSVPVFVTVSGAGATPTGTVAITGADINCTITLIGGSGTCNVTFNTTGAKTITATYSGDVNYLVSLDTEAHIVN